MIDPRFMRPALAVLAALQLLLGLWLIVSPETFFDAVASFGHENKHFLRDISSIYIALGLGLAVAVKAVSWRVPILFVTTIQYVIHTANHIVDIGDADGFFIGLFSLLSLLLVTLVLISLLNIAYKQQKFAALSNESDVSDTPEDAPDQNHDDEPGRN